QDRAPPADETMSVVMKKREAERESARAGRRGLGAWEQRSARRARAADGPPGAREAERESARAARGGSRAGWVWGARRTPRGCWSAAPAGRHWTGPQEGSLTK